MTTTNDPHGPGRYQPLGPDDRREMLDVVGVESFDDLFSSIPAGLQFSGDLHVEEALSEAELIRHLGQLAAANGPSSGMLSFLGAGCYPHFVPTHVDALIQRQEFMTSYTPYQAEISQGTLQAIFEFQTLVAMLTGMEVCNASMYDGSSAVAEAVLMARRLARRGGRVLWSEGLHPAYREVADEAVDACAADGVIPGVPLGRFDAQRDHELLVCATEVHTRADIDKLVQTLDGVCS